MKRKLFLILLAFLPFIASAQDDPALVKDFYKGIRSRPVSFMLNGHTNIMGINLDDENFDVTAISDKMQVTWKTTLKGFVFSVCKFKDKILAVASTEYGGTKRNNNTFKGYIIDPDDGKVLLEKVIFDGPQEYLSFPYIYTGNGAFFKLIIRQSGYERRMHVGLALISINAYVRQFHETRDMDVIDFNEKLEPVNKFKPEITTGTFLALTCNSHNDLFIDWFNNGNMNISRYEAGKNKPSGKLTSNMVVDKEILDNFIDEDIAITASKKNDDVMYCALVFKNHEKEMELGIDKFDFATGQKKYSNELFTKDHLKALKKSYVPVNKKMDSPDLGAIKELQVRYLKEMGDRLVVSLTSTTWEKGMSGGTWQNEFSILLNNYDTDLNLKWQQLIPTGYSMPVRLLPTGYYYNQNKLFVISNDKRGATTLNGVFCSFDLNSGQCDKMDWLSKKKIGNGEIAGSSSVLWFEHSFVVPYLEVRGMSGGKYDVTLQQNRY